jgi:hypothetical protein
MTARSCCSRSTRNRPPLPEQWMFDPETLTILSLGFVLGLRHALDADHLAALSTVLAERPTVQASTAIGFVLGTRAHPHAALCGDGPAVGVEPHDS